MKIKYDFNPTKIFLPDDCWKKPEEPKQTKDYVVYTIKYEGTVKYVGFTGNFKERRHGHRSRGKKSSIPKWADMNKIEFEIIDHTDTKCSALLSERANIQKYDTINNGWNKVL